MVDRHRLSETGSGKTGINLNLMEPAGMKEINSEGLSIPIFPGISLAFGDPLSDQAYPTGRLQKGFILLDGDADLAEEAVGFGVPVLKRGLQSIFSGEVAVSWQKHGSTWVVNAEYKLNLVEKISKGGDGDVGNKPFYAVKDYLADLIRRFPTIRRILTSASSLLRQIFHWKTTYAEGGLSTAVNIIYTLEEGVGRMRVDVDASGLSPDITEVVVMNEQGAQAFDQYRDSSGNFFQGERVGCWDEVDAEEAWFESSTRQVVFRLGHVEVARLFRGRELIGSRLSWAGFGYTFPPSVRTLHYELRIEKPA
jgi:hypothetical protein